MTTIGTVPRGSVVPRAPITPVRGLAFGGDYNPEQWPEEVWAEDIALMREAHVNIVTLGVFSWALIEVDDGVWEFDRLDRLIGMLHDGGIAVDLATPTAAPPIWLHRSHPEILPVDRRGTRFHQGGRLQWCASHPTWRAYATRVATKLGERYGANPAVAMWHVSNELGGGNRRCYCEVSSAAFRNWLADRYGDIETLNEAWGTAFWGLRLRSFDDAQAPLDSEAAQNPGLLLDFDRFSNDELLAHYRAERDALRDAGVTTPITTNLMVGSRGSVLDHAAWASEVDVVANDHYTIAADPLRHRELAFAADRTRGLDLGRPWLLMEHAAGAVNWQSRNRPKAPGELLRDSLHHVARGADGALFFQWRQSVAGAEQFHSGMLPHSGPRTRQWREVVELGAVMHRLAEVAGSVVEPARAALLLDDQAIWAWEAGQKPVKDYAITGVARRWHEALGERGVLTDIVPSDRDLDGYDLIVVPALFLVSDEGVAAVARAAERGATVVVTHLSGTVDPSNRVRRGGYAGAYREMLGVFVDEYLPLLEGDSIALSSGAAATDWTERIEVEPHSGTQPIVLYADGPLAGLPAITRRPVGDGAAWYVSADLQPAGVAALVDRALAERGIAPTVPVVPGVVAVRRVGSDASYLFLLNHGDAPARPAVTGFDLVAGHEVAGDFTLAPGACAVLRETRTTA